MMLQHQENEARVDRIKSWEEEQYRIKILVRLEDDPSGFLSFHEEHRQIGALSGLRLVAGADLSLAKESDELGAATIVVCEFPSLKVVYEASEHVRVTEPYEAGFLAFRESPCILALLAKLHRSCPHLYPQVLLVDGNGILHPRRCGIASTVGVLADLPTIGVAKNLMEIEGLKRKVVATAARAALHRRGDHVPLLSRENGELLGAALKTTDASPRPIFVSVGHRISLPTALELVTACATQARVPEPIRQADLRSREMIDPRGRCLLPARSPSPLRETSDGNSMKSPGWTAATWEGQAPGGD